MNNVDFSADSSNIQASADKAPLKWSQKLVSEKLAKLRENDASFKQLANDPKKLKFNFEDQKAELREQIMALKTEEVQLKRKIYSEISKARESVGTDFMEIFDRSSARLSAGFEVIELDAKQLSENLKLVSNLAQSISDRVSVLDVGKSRVVECLQRVSDLRDLKTCAEGVEKAMKSGEYDEAAHNIHRFLTLDSVILKMGDQVDAKDAGYSVKNSYETLRKASAELKRIIEKKFDDANASGDVASMERFFKLFPLINEHSAGLQRFGRYLCSKIESIGNEHFKIMEAGGTDDKRQKVIYADTMMLILEGVARLVELHLPLIDNFYGPDKLLNLIEYIQPECDRQTLRVVNAFIQRRQFEQKVRQVEQYVNRVHLAATGQTADRSVEQSHGQLWSSSIQKSASTGDLERNKLDALELDVLLYEVALMHTRAELFWRFLRRRLNKTEEAAKIKQQEDAQNCEDFESDEQRRDREEALKNQRMERDRKLDTIMNRTSLNTKMQELLGKYVLLEQYYMTESVKKAIDMDSIEDGSLTSSLLDDVFFIVKKCIRRSISSSSVDCVCAMINNGVTLLETSYLNCVNAHIKVLYDSFINITFVLTSGYPTSGGSWIASSASEAYQSAYNAVLSTSQSSKDLISSSFVSSSNERLRSAFVVALNNLRGTVECVATLRTGMSDDFDKYLGQANVVDKRKLENSMEQFDELCRRIEHYLLIGHNKLCETAFRPALKKGFDPMLEISHVLNDEQLADSDSNDLFIRNFIASLDRQISMFDKLLVPENFQLLLGIVCAEVALQFEKIIFKCAFNRLGGLQLDKECRQLISYMTDIAGWTIREKCAKLTQVVAILNSDSVDEAVEYFQQLKSGLIPSSNRSTASLSLNELKKALLLRTDYSRDVVKALKI